MAQVSAPISRLIAPLDTAFASRGAVRVLRVLVWHGGQLSLPRIVHDARLSLPGVQKVLEGLLSSGLVEMAGSGRARLYRAAPGHPVTAMLEALFEAETTYRPMVLVAIRSAAAGLPVEAMGLYGSAARGEDGPESDLDLLAVTAANDLGQHERVAAELRERLLTDPLLRPLRPSLVALSLSEARGMAERGDPFWNSVLSEAIPVPGLRPLQGLDLAPVVP